jgi:hypothetical protein
MSASVSTLLNQKLCDVYRSLRVGRIVESTGLQGTGHVAWKGCYMNMHLGETYIFKIIVWKTGAIILRWILEK